MYMTCFLGGGGIPTCSVLLLLVWLLAAGSVLLRPVSAHHSSILPGLYSVMHTTCTQAEIVNV